MAIARTINRQVTVDPQEDETVLTGRKDQPSITYLRHGSRAPFFYAWRPEQRAFGAQLHELCEIVSPEEVQEAITRTAEYEDLAEYANLDRLLELGFRVPTPEE